MVRLVPRAFAATVALLAAGFSPATASADPVLVFPGMEIRQDNHVCTLGYVDPALKIAFTAGHCRGGGAVTSRDYKVIGHLRAFRDNTPSGSTVATHELIADYEAIVLADDVTASNILPSGRALESRPGVVLHPGGFGGPGLPGPRWRPRADRRDLQQRLGRLSRGGVLAVDVRAGSRGSRRDAPCLASTPLAATRLIAVCLLER